MAGTFSDLINIAKARKLAQSWSPSRVLKALIFPGFDPLPGLCSVHGGPQPSRIVVYGADAAWPPVSCASRVRFLIPFLTLIPVSPYDVDLPPRGPRQSDCSAPCCTCTPLFPESRTLLIGFQASAQLKVPSVAEFLNFLGTLRLTQWGKVSAKSQNYFPVLGMNCANKKRLSPGVDLTQQNLGN